MGTARRLAVVAAIGALAALIWIRLGLYGFGLPVGLVVLVPVVLLGWLYMRLRRVVDLGALLGAFGLSWAAFEGWVWLNAESDPAVSIPGWSPIPLATAVALLLIGIAVLVRTSSVAE